MKLPARALGLPVASAGAAWAVSAVVFAVYLATQQRDLSTWDSALIALVAQQGGVGHPPGYPLHTWLGFLLARFPGVAPSLSIVWASAIPGALSCLPIASLAWQLAPASPAGHPARWSHLALAGAGVATAALALHPQWWDPATRVEVYSLAAFLALWALARLAAVLELGAPADEAGGAGPPPGPPLAPWSLLPVGLGLGLAASAHPVVAALVALAGVPWLIARWRRLSLRSGAGLVAGGLAGLGPYLIIPLVARRQGVLIWGDPTAPAAFWRFLRGADFAQNVGPTGGGLGAHLYEWLGWAAAHGVLLLLLLGAVGWWRLGRRRPVGVLAGPLTAAAAVVAIAANVVWFPENPDYLGYTAGSFAVCAAGGVALIASLIEGSTRARVVAAVGLALVVGTALVSPPALLGRTRARDDSVRVLAAGALGEAPPRAILVVESDHWVWPLLYLQEVERVRPDVVVLPLGLGSSSWYWRHLAARHPRLAPFALAGPGGRNGRVYRFLQAQADRPRAFEHLALARGFGTQPAAVGFLLQDRPASPPVDPELASAAMDRAAARIGLGSPDGFGVLALAAYVRGEALWRLGQPAAAYRALLAGVPPPLRPSGPAPENLQRVPPPPGPLPPAIGLRGLGDPAVNVTVARALSDAAR